MKNTITLKAGKYYIGDPSYIFNESWGNALHAILNFDDGGGKLFGKDCFASGTSTGDGVYRDSERREYAVDCGMLSLLPISLLRRDSVFTVKDIVDKTHPHLKDLIHIVEFDKDFGYC